MLVYGVHWNGTEQVFFLFSSFSCSNRVLHSESIVFLQRVMGRISEERLVKILKFR